MNIEFICEHCGKLLSVEEYQAGQQIACYHCSAPVVIPEEGQTTIIDFQCLGCGTEFRVPAAKAGTRTKCPNCSAVLVVPGASGTPGVKAVDAGTLPEATPVVADELPDLPPPVPCMRTRPAAAASAVAPAPQDPEAPLYIPPSSKVSAGWIIFWAVLAVFAVVAIGLLLTRGGGEEEYDTLDVRIKYDPNLDILSITNESKSTWTDITLTLQAGEVKYVYRLDRLGPGEKTSPVLTKFRDDRGSAFSSQTIKAAKLTGRAKVAGSDRPGRFSAPWECLRED